MTDTQIFLLIWLITGMVGWVYYLFKIAYLQAQIQELERKSKKLSPENQATSQAKTQQNK